MGAQRQGALAPQLLRATQSLGFPSEDFRTVKTFGVKSPIYVGNRGDMWGGYDE